MSFSAHRLPAVLLTILSLPTLLWAQPAPKETTKAGRGSISGRVTLKGKGARGRFLIEGVAPGTYVIQAVISMGPNVRGRMVKHEITIPDGVTTDVKLTIDMNPSPEKP